MHPGWPDADSELLQGAYLGSGKDNILRSGNQSQYRGVNFRFGFIPRHTRNETSAFILSARRGVAKAHAFLATWSKVSTRPQWTNSGAIMQEIWPNEVEGTETP